MKILHTEVLVIGGGIAALKAREAGAEVVLVSSYRKFPLLGPK